MTVVEWVQTYLANLFRELFDAFRCLAVELLSILCRREGLDLVFEGVALRNQLEDTGEIGTLLGSHLCCGCIRGRGTVTKGKDGRSAKHSEVI